MPSRPITYLNEHAGLLVSATIAIAVVVRLLAISLGNLTTLSGLIGSAGTATVLLGTIGQTMPIMSMAALGVSAALLTAGKQHLRISAPIFVLAGALSWAITPWPLVILMVVIFAVAWTIAWISDRGRSGPRHNAISLLVSLVGVLVIITLASSRPWLPAEEVAIGPGRPIVGYVLSSDADGAVVLRDNPRQIVEVKNVVARRYCEVKRSTKFGLGWDRYPSIGQIFANIHIGHYPTCESTSG